VPYKQVVVFKRTLLTGTIYRFIYTGRVNYHSSEVINWISLLEARLQMLDAIQKTAITFEDVPQLILLLR